MFIYSSLPSALGHFVAVEQWGLSNIPKEKNQERECRASVKTPLIQSHTSRILIVQI